MFFSEDYFIGNIAYDYEKSGDYTAALSIYADRIKTSPNDFFNYYRCLIINRKLKNYSEEQSLVELAQVHFVKDEVIAEFLNERKFRLSILTGEISKGAAKAITEIKKQNRDAESKLFNVKARRNDIERYRTLDFVIGYEIRLSNNEKHHYEECLAMAGKYPKSFSWDGCCENCICHVVSITADRKEFEFMQKKKIQGIKVLPKNSIKTIPHSFLNYVAVNSEKYEAMLKKPLFITENFIDGEVSKGMDFVKLGLLDNQPDASGDSIIKRVANLFKWS